MNYEPHCLMAWREMAAGMSDQGDYFDRTVEQTMADLNKALAELTVIESLPHPHDEDTVYRRSVNEYIAARAIKEAQSIQDMRQVIRRAQKAP